MIRERVRLRRDQRGALSSWPFHRLGQHLKYKARGAGVAFVTVDARYTSQRCPRCGHTDVVAGVNVRDRARSVWAFVTMPVPTRT